MLTTKIMLPSSLMLGDDYLIDKDSFARRGHICEVSRMRETRFEKVPLYETF